MMPEQKNDFNLSVESNSHLQRSSFALPCSPIGASFARVFPRFKSAVCMSFEFWLVPWIISGFSDDFGLGLKTLNC